MTQGQIIKGRWSFTCPICTTDLTLFIHEKDLAPAPHEMSHIPTHPLMIGTASDVSIAVDCPTSGQRVYPRCDRQHVFKQHSNYPMASQLSCMDPTCWKGFHR